MGCVYVSVGCDAAALFMMRDADIVSSIPEGLQYLFVDSNPRAPEKLAALKKNISKRFPVVLVFSE